MFTQTACTEHEVSIAVMTTRYDYALNHLPKKLAMLGIARGARHGQRPNFTLTISCYTLRCKHIVRYVVYTSLVF